MQQKTVLCLVRARREMVRGEAALVQRTTVSCVQGGGGGASSGGNLISCPPAKEDVGRSGDSSSPECSSEVGVANIIAVPGATEDPRPQRSYCDVAGARHDRAAIQWRAPERPPIVIRGCGSVAGGPAERWARVVRFSVSDF